MAKKHLTVTAPLVVLKGANGAHHHLYAGTPVPEGMDDEHVAQLLKAGMLAEVKVEAPKEPSVKEILAEVGEDKEKAAVALEAEKAKGEDARTSLVEPLQKLLEQS